VKEDKRVIALSALINWT